MRLFPRRRCTDSGQPRLFERGYFFARCARQLAALVLCGGATAPLLAQPAALAVRAPAFVAPDGTIERNALLTIRGGKFERVGGDAGSGVTVDEFDRGVICAGLIDALAQISAVGNLNENAQTVQPLARGLDALDRYHPHLRLALEAGVTAFALAPDDSNLIGGRVAVISTAAGIGAAPTALDGPLKLSLAPAAFLPDRDPTSRSGALALLRRTLSEAHKNSDASAAPLAQLVSGKTRAVAAAPTGADVLSFLTMSAEHKFPLTLVHTLDSRELGGEIGRGGAAVIVGPLDFVSPARAALAAGLLEKSKVTVAIGGGMPFRPADSLRIGAAVAARNGLSVAAARRAITLSAAESLGVASEIGSIEAGKRADFVVFSGDPLDLRSSVRAVYVAGRRVFTANEESQP